MPTGDSANSGQLKLGDLPESVVAGESPLSPSRGYQSLLMSSRANRAGSLSGAPSERAASSVVGWGVAAPAGRRMHARGRA